MFLGSRLGAGDRRILLGVNRFALVLVVAVQKKQTPRWGHPRLYIGQLKEDSTLKFRVQLALITTLVSLATPRPSSACTPPPDLWDSLASYPADGAAEISPDAELVLSFGDLFLNVNDPLEVVLSVEVVEVPSETPISGALAWTDEMQGVWAPLRVGRAAWRPDVPFGPNRRYRVTIRLEPVLATSFGSTRTFDFFTSEAAWTPTPSRLSVPAPTIETIYKKFGTCAAGFDDCM